MNCRTCGAPLTADEVALHKKMISRQATDFLCLSCMAKHFDCDTELLEKKIDQFRQTGCVLFLPPDEQPKI